MRVDPQAARTVPHRPGRAGCRMLKPAPSHIAPYPPVRAAGPGPRDAQTIGKRAHGEIDRVPNGLLESDPLRFAACEDDREGHRFVRGRLNIICGDMPLLSRPLLPRVCPSRLHQPRKLLRGGRSPPGDTEFLLKPRCDVPPPGSLRMPAHKSADARAITDRPCRFAQITRHSLAAVFADRDL